MRQTREGIRTRGRREGLALVLVMTVILALAIVATPFVLSMILQEQSGTALRYASQADYGADGARSYALWRLMFSLDPLERRGGGGPFASYFYDVPQEFDIRLDEPSLQAAGIADPKGSIWGLQVQDEQGKLNVKSAPPGAVLNLAQIVAGRPLNNVAQFHTASLAPLKDFLTQYSGRDATWIAPQRIRPFGFQQGPTAAGGGLTVDNLHLLGPESRVRVSKSGLPPIETTIGGNAVLAQVQNAGFTTRDPITGYVDGVIEVEWRHPVNINTARRETLIAVFEGLRLYNVQGSLVDRGAALQLAQAFAGRPTQRLEQFLNTLSGVGISPQQKVAVALNAVCPSAALLEGSGTVPFCFRSYDVHTLEAAASMNNPAGAEMAGRGFREVVSVSPPAVLTRFVESQLDFDQMLALGADMSAMIPQARLATGYPFGNRMVSYPRMLPVPGATTVAGQLYGPSDVALKPQQQPPGDAYVMPGPARDFRGESRYDQDLAAMGWPQTPGVRPQDQQPREHFDGSQEGLRLKSTAHSYPWGQVFIQDPPPSQSPGPAQTSPDCTAGGIELWVRFEGTADPVTILDIREQDYSNRITLRVERGELILTVSDGTVGLATILNDDGAAEIRQPFTPVPQTWYHFGAYWKGNQYADLALLVDGFAHPQQKFSHVNPQGSKVITKTAGTLDAMSTGISLQDDSFARNEPTALLIGNEVVLYDATTGTHFRGQRGTTAVAHVPQATVSLFGYSSKLRNGQVTVDNGQYPPCVYDRLTRGGGTLTYNFGLNPQATVAGDKQDPMTMMRYIDAAQTDIGVNTANIMDFPDQGYLTIENEVVFYTGRSTGGVGGQGNAKFTGCARGQQGTTAGQHNDGRPVRLWSVAVTNHANYLSPTIIAVGDEWFGPVQKDTARPGFWISFVVGGQPLGLRRGLGVFQSIPQNHTAGEMVVPTFLVRESFPPQGRLAVGSFDRVTVMDAQNQKEPQRVRRSGPPPPPPPSSGQQPWQGMTIQLTGGAGGNAQIVAFEGNVIRDYVADDWHVRILKFPSGELLGLNWLMTANPQLSIGPLDGTIDEIKAFAAPRPPYNLVGQLDASVTALQLNQDPGLAQFGGLLKIGDEYVGYGQKGGGQPVPVQQLRRGWLNSTAEVHDAGDSVFALPWIPVTTLAQNVTATDSTLYLNMKLPGHARRGQYDRGYVLVEDEVIGFEWNGGNNGLTLGMPPRWDGTSGLYRGMFGTAATNHSSMTALVYGIPFRYWDTYKPREFDNTMVYFQWSTKMDLARWRSMTWTQEITPADPNVVVHCLVRVDGKGEFWDPPGFTDAVLVKEFVNPARNPIDRTGHQHDAGQFDVRFYVEYRPGSYDALQPWNAHSWKRVPKIKEIRVEYDRPLQTLYHEDR